MILPLTRLAIAAGFASTIALSTASCSLLPRPTPAAPALPSVAAVKAPSTRVLQMSYGRDAYFAACAEASCPSITPKTLPPFETRQAVVLHAPVRASALQVAGTVQEPAQQPVQPVPVPAMPAMPAVPPTRGEASELHLSLEFSFASAALTETARGTLRRALPNARHSERIVISGRTDSVGSNEVNQQLALARALAVRDYLRQTAPDLPGTIEIDAKGRCCFVAPNDSEGGRSKNRRVEVVFLSAGAS